MDRTRVVATRTAAVAATARTTTGTDTGAGSDTGPRRRTLVGATIVALFAVIIAAQNMPSWLGRNEPVVRSPIEQRWNLFAPNPPTANLSTFLLIRYRIDGRVVTTAPLDLSAAVRADAHDARLVASKLVRVLTKTNVALERVAFAEASRGSHAVSRDRATTADVYRRTLSAAAKTAAPTGAEIVSVRGVLVRGAVRPFADRDAPAAEMTPIVSDPDTPPPPVSADVRRQVAGQRSATTALLFDSGWMRFASDVAPMRIEL